VYYINIQHLFTVILFPLYKLRPVKKAMHCDVIFMQINNAFCLLIPLFDNKDKQCYNGYFIYYLQLRFSILKDKVKIESNISLYKFSKWIHTILHKQDGKHERARASTHVFTLSTRFQRKLG
jgi:hypothetical protein